MSVFKDNLLEGQVAFITGGGSGICKGIAEAYLCHGAKVAIFARKEERLKEAATELSELTGGTCIPVVGDVRKPETIAAAIARTQDDLGALSIVINGAAGNFLAPASQLSPRAFRTVMEIDTMGTYNVSRAAFDAGLRDSGGNIINISATLHYGATPLQIHAAAAKAGVDVITRTLALEWAGMGIRVNGIAPGPIEGTEGVSRLVPPDMKAKMVSEIPLRRFGTIHEIANVALFLASDAASLLHGATIVADGGAWFGSSLLSAMGAT